MSMVLPVKPDGDVPIPHDVRERLRWNGSNVVMEEVGDSVILRRQDASDRAVRAEFDRNEIRRHVPRWDGPIGTSATWKAAVEHMFAERGRRHEYHSAIGYR